MLLGYALLLDVGMQIDVRGGLLVVDCMFAVVVEVVVALLTQIRWWWMEQEKERQSHQIMMLMGPELLCFRMHQWLGLGRELIRIDHLMELALSILN